MTLAQFQRTVKDEDSTFILKPYAKELYPGVEEMLGN